MKTPFRLTLSLVILTVVLGTGACFKPSLKGRNLTSSSSSATVTSVAQAVWQWVVELGSPGANMSPSNAFTLDSANNAIIAGQTLADLTTCTGGISSNCTATSSVGINDAYVIKWDSAANWKWTAQLGEATKNTIQKGVTTDRFNNVYVGGTTNGNIVACAGVSGVCGGGSS